MAQTFIQDRPLRDLVLSSSPDTPEHDVLAQISMLSLEIFHEDAIDDYSQPGSGGRLWCIYDYGSPKSSSSTANFSEPSSFDRLVSEASTVASSATLESDNNSECTFEPGTAGRPRLLGFLLGKLIAKKNMVAGGEAFNIVYACVPKHLRGKGVGKKLVNAALAHAKQRKNVALVSLWALPESVRFWEGCGLKIHSCQDDDDAALEAGAHPGQRYMEIKTVGKGKHKRTKRKDKSKSPEPKSKYA